MLACILLPALTRASAFRLARDLAKTEPQRKPRGGAHLRGFALGRKLARENREPFVIFGRDAHG